MNAKLIAIPDRRAEEPTTVIVPDEFPPRASDKDVKRAKDKATKKVGTPAKHKPSAAVIAQRELDNGRKPNARQQADLDVIKDVPRETKPQLPTLAERKEGRAKVEAAIDKQSPAPGVPYQGPMTALRAHAKGYVKAANGQPCNGDPLALALGQLTPPEVIKACCVALDILNPYLHLNVGQQSMNLRNKLRGALKREEFGMGVVKEAVEDVILARKPLPGEKA